MARALYHLLRVKIGRQVEAATRHSGSIRVRNRLFAVCVVEVWAELSVLLAYLTPVELHCCMDLPERLGCPASGRNGQNPFGIDYIHSG